MTQKPENLDPEEWDDADERLARLRGEAITHERTGGARLVTALILVIAAIVGMWASISLLLAEHTYHTDPTAALKCDINILFGCSDWIDTWQNELFFGISNAWFGLVFFVAVLVFSVWLALGKTWPRVFWIAGAVGSMLGIAWIFWFQYQSFFVKGILCPYCSVTWLATIPLSVTLIGAASQAGHLGTGLEGFGRFLVRNRWGVIGLWYLALVLFVFAWFWDKWMIIFGLN